VSDNDQAKTKQTGGLTCGTTNNQQESCWADNPGNKCHIDH
jgi:hypothetical protein